MSPSDEISSDPELAGLSEAGAYGNVAAAREHGLVVLAMGLPYWLDESSAGCRLLVQPAALADVRHQLELFDRESAYWPPPVVQPYVLPRERFLSPLLWVIVVLGSFQLQWLRSPRWTEYGRLDPTALFGRDEWWRPLTALFLHGDVAHLTGNLVIGFFVFAEVVGLWGVVRGWILIFAAAVVANVASAALHAAGEYRSLGASTAVFAGVGLLTGRAAALAWRTRNYSRLRHAVKPLAAGAILVGLFGGGGMRTDVVAHVLGFLAGLAVGVLPLRRVRGADDRMS